ncbi:8835_t:CDS:2, partial [Gigaspora margarita]
MSVKQKILKDEYKKLLITGVRTYKINDYYTSYNCFSITSIDSEFKYNAKFYLAKQYENVLGMSKSYIEKITKKLRGIELLLAERVEKGLGNFKDDEKAFNFYSDLYTK